MHQQHAADYVHLMVEARISLPMGEDQSVRLVMEVLSFSFFCYFLCHSVFHFWSLCKVWLFIHSSQLPLFLQTLQKIWLANHIHSMAELLHSDAMQQMEVALLGSLAAKLLDILLMSMQSTHSTQHQVTPHQPQTLPFHPLASTFISPLPPTISIAGVTDTKEPTDDIATSSGLQAPTSPAQKEPMTSKCWCIIPMPIPPTTLMSSSSSSHLPIIVGPELAIPMYTLLEHINHPEGCKYYKYQMCAF